VTLPLPISVCMISGAEAARIGRALTSVTGLASEIVVVLNEEVRDDTEAICREHGAQVLRHPWGGFRAQKNLAQSYASRSWILQLDADEEVSRELRAELERFFTGDHNRFVGAWCPRKVWFMGRWITHGDWYPDRVLRLYRRDAGLWGGSPEHCSVEIQGATTRLRGDLFHYTNPTVASYVHKIPYYADLYLQRQLAANARWSAPSAIVRAVWRFLRAYIVRAGFLDGYPGFFIAASTAYATLARHTRLYEHLYSTPPPPSVSAPQ
jgi:glycosyltransferase involved in cell wall biosynthesis